jgi:hypothetical protein
MRRIVSEGPGRRSLARRPAPWAFAAALGWLGLSASACLQQVGTGTGTTDPTATATTGTATASDAVPTGTGCTTDPASQITLCEGSSVCPGLDVDPGALSGCGFRLRAGGVIDLECLCADALCPIGVADTCAQATQLLSSQTSLSVCEQTSEGRCVQVVTGQSPGSSSGSSTTSPSANGCDKTCESECAGEPDCIQLCGC